MKSSEYMPVEEIKPGMEGYGLTVFQGTKVERFQVKVIGVVKQVLSGRDAILVRLSGPHMGKNNIIKGMSGSPIYISNRLIGALSYGFDFSKEPIVGITPIVDMLDALSFDNRSEKPRHISQTNLKERGFPLPAQFSPREFASGAGTGALSRSGFGAGLGIGAGAGFDSNYGPSFSQSFSSGAAPRMVPLLAPVVLAGFSNRAQAYLQKEFAENLGLGLTLGGAAGGINPQLAAESAAHGGGNRTGANSEKSADKALDRFSEKLVAPGSAVAVMLSTGDFSAAGTGTATCNFGKKFVAFGHSFLEAGGVSFPLASAYIHDILPSLAVSFKLASPIEVIGTIFADRPWSIGGEVGRQAELLPLNLTVSDEVRKVSKQYHSRIVEHPDLTASLTTAIVMSALDATYQSQSPYVVKVKTVVDMVERGKLERVDRFAVNFPAHPSTDILGRLKILREPVSGYVGTLVDRIVDNDYERTRIKNVDVDITIEDGRNVSRIEKIYLDRASAAPGETVSVYCRLKPYDGAAVVEKLSFTLPRDLPDGDIAIGVCGGDELEALRKRMGVGDPAPENFTQVLARIKRKERSDKLCGLIALPRQSMILSGEVLRNPPAHWIKPYFSERATHPPALVRGEEKVSRLLDSIVDGSHVVALTVKRSDKVFSKPLPFFFTPPSVSASDSIMMTEQARKALDQKSKDTSSTSAATQSATSQGSQSSTASSSSTSQPASTAAAGAKPPTLWSQARTFPHLRGVNSFYQHDESELRNGKCEGVVVDSLGRLYPGFKERRVFELGGEARPVASAYFNGVLYYLSENKLFALEKTIEKDGVLRDESVKAPILIAELPALLATSLAVKSDGTAFIGTAQSNGAKGQVLSLKLNGAPAKPTVFARVEEEIITSLALDEKGLLYIGTAGTGRLYRMEAEPVLFYDCKQAHVSALSYSSYDKRIYVGTAERGLVVSLSTEGDKAARTEFESGEHLVTGLARDKAGNLYVATAGQGKLFRISKDGEVETVALSEAFYTLYYDSSEDRIYTGDAEGDVTRVAYDNIQRQAFFFPVCHTEQEAVQSISCDGVGHIFILTSNVGLLKVVDVSPSGSCVYTSTVLDATKKSVFSRLRLYNADGASDSNATRLFQVETRSGDSSQPDQTWSDWRLCQADPESETLGAVWLVPSPAAKFIQYRLTWKPELLAEKILRKRAVGGIEITYQPSNSAPSFGSVSLSAGDALSGSETIAVTGSDADMDNLLLAVEISGDGGKTWTVLNGDIRSRKAGEKGKKKKTETAKVNDADGSAKDAETSKELGKGGTREVTKDEGKRGKSSSSAGDTEKRKKNGEISGKKVDKQKEKDANSESEESQRKKNGEISGKKVDKQKEKDADSESEEGKRKKNGEFSGKEVERSPEKDLNPEIDGQKQSKNQKTSIFSKIPLFPFDARGFRLDQRLEENPKDEAPNSGERERESEGKSAPAAENTESNEAKGGKAQSSEAIEIASEKSTEGFNASEKFTYQFETKKQKDGRYLLRLTLSDRPSNADKPGLAFALRDVIIDNTPPYIVSGPTFEKVGEDRLNISLKVSDKTSEISDVTYRIDGYEPFSFSVVDGLADGKSLTLNAPRVFAPRGSSRGLKEAHKVTIEIIDRAGNSHKSTHSLP
ncbi:MAG: hypothetical protein K2Y32_06720 [Candidatus Obscuribacterales bacterium]|nr:hypothetical protein [Candidatus Obscuribacterales bacterium]